MSSLSAQVLVETPRKARRRTTNLALAEYDKAGNLRAKFIESAPAPGSTRVDILLPTTRKKPWRRILDIFLPDGYPHSVTDDYAAYQIYDSFQAFAGTIAGMISSRAVWEGMGVGDSMASPTGAMMIQVIRESMGRFGTIAFAHLMGTSIEAECKAYRMASDVLCSIAFVLDCLSPLFPTNVRFLVLCFSSILFSASGVAGNASKSSLSGHFAKWNNLGELNAKDASQETAISLMGMLTGTIVVSLLTTPTATWTTLFVLIAIYLFLNWKGVRAVKSRSLNRQRANIAFSALLSRDEVLTPGDIAEREFIFERRGGEVFRWDTEAILGHCKFGVPLETMLHSLANGHQTMRSFQLPTVDMSTLMELFEDQQYLLWCQVSDTPSFDAASKIKVLVVLKTGVSAKSQLKAWFHGLLLVQRLSCLETSRLEKARLGQHIMLEHIEASLRIANERYEGYVKRLSTAGWNMEVAVLETRSGCRIMLETDDNMLH
ncbi:DUF647 domain-containing protein [Colletotrichum truncatum]|uniref:DUF647 domain-containing protein n=1 Tax=Colletotrichum truncatum TaxID=5467 RepID=A0ACC3YGX9_COLTU|nr:duf647 domain-containing protein [Colletotrichum truncatum]KAF6784082.1 duf647 domain-containing protein [Colletotrichum truncatum]